MKVKLVSIGNSKGIRIPQSIIKACGFENEVEILGAMQSLYPDLPQVNPEELAELRTLGQITDHMSQQMPATKKKSAQLTARSLP